MTPIRRTRTTPFVGFVFILLALSLGGCQSAPAIAWSEPVGSPTALIYDQAADEWTLEVDPDAPEPLQEFPVITRTPGGDIVGRFVMNEWPSTRNPSSYTFSIVPWPSTIEWEIDRYVIRFSQHHRFRRHEDDTRPDFEVRTAMREQKPEQTSPVWAMGSSRSVGNLGIDVIDGRKNPPRGARR